MLDAYTVQLVDEQMDGASSFTGYNKACAYSTHSLIAQTALLYVYWVYCQVIVVE